MDLEHLSHLYLGTWPPLSRPSVLFILSSNSLVMFSMTPKLLPSSPSQELAYYTPFLQSSITFWYYLLLSGIIYEC